MTLGQSILILSSYSLWQSSSHFGLPNASFMGTAVAQWLKCCATKSEGRWFDSSRVSLEFFIDIKSFRSHYGPVVDSASNRNEYQEHFLGVKAAVA